jgi:hypothetical protein
VDTESDGHCIWRCYPGGADSGVFAGKNPALQQPVNKSGYPAEFVKQSVELPLFGLFHQFRLYRIPVDGCILIIREKNIFSIA